MNLAAHYETESLSISQDPEDLVEAHLPLIRYHAHQLLRRVPDSIELDDLINAGVLGLLDGATRFDESKGIQFRTFVSFRVRGAMIDYLRDFDWLPRGLRDNSKGLQRAIRVLEQEHGRPAEEKEIASHLGISLLEYRNRLTELKTLSVVYFDDLPPIGHDDDIFNILESISGDPDAVPDRQIEMLDFTNNLAQAISKLPEREKILITLYYCEELTMKEVAAILDVTESRISQLHSQMVLRLRAFLNLDIPNGRDE